MKTAQPLPSQTAKCVIVHGLNRESVPDRRRYVANINIHSINRIKIELARD